MLLRQMGNRSSVFPACAPMLHGWAEVIEKDLRLAKGVGQIISSGS